MVYYYKAFQSKMHSNYTYTHMDWMSTLIFEKKTSRTPYSFTHDSRHYGD